DLGRAQADGGTDAGIFAFHDVVSGNVSYNTVTGPSAGPGYDSASGWGSLNVAALAALLPGCTALADGGTLFSNPQHAGPPFDACGWMACDGGRTGRTLTDGPWACLLGCTVGASPSGCLAGTVCSGETIFSLGGGGGVCVPGCLLDADCVVSPGTVCSTCVQQ